MRAAWCLMALLCLAPRSAKPSSVSPFSATCKKCACTCELVGKAVVRQLAGMHAAQVREGRHSPCSLQPFCLAILMVTQPKHLQAHGAPCRVHGTT